MGWLVDTGIWIAVERGILSAADIHAITRQSPIYLSPVNIAELRFGLELLKSSRQKQRAAAMLRRMRRKPQLRITLQTAETFGMLAAKIRTAGKDPNVRINDLWLAAQTIQRDLTLLTSNPKDFADIPGLKIVTIKL
ncbi:MAG TPA: PIN domain-containing protein [Pyrinomonadaceae bacterium]|nr:PIN domain-containing protein [Pyrinomonadaceae bacterium]